MIEQKYFYVHLCFDVNIQQIGMEHVGLRRLRYYIRGVDVKIWVNLRYVNGGGSGKYG